MSEQDRSTGFTGQPNAAVADQLRSAVTLRQFLQVPDKLAQPERILIVEQAQILFEHNYVHLPLKRAMHAVDPVQRLRLLKYRLEGGERMSELEFHAEMTRVFNSVRDLHTNYLLPEPFVDATAFLPFQLEEFWEGRKRRFLVSKVVEGFKHPTFGPGVEVMYWNGMPVQRAVEVNGDRQAGGNPAARFAKGLATLSTRPLVRSLPPDEEWVTVGYRIAGPEGPRDLEIRVDWLVFSPKSPAPTIDPNKPTKHAAALGTDVQTEELNRARKVLFAPAAVEAERKTVRGGGAQSPGKDALETTLPGVMKARAVRTRFGAFAHVRLFSFTVPDADEFVAEFVRLVRQLPQEGLVVDVRGNGGGLIYAGERLLQVMTPRRIEPERAQFINSPLNREICALNREGELQLGPWERSIAQAVETGAQYSLGFPITDPESANNVGQQYQGPIVLVTDALCYSTTDLFAAGFQDHAVGKIIGINANNTGAGGANVWTQSLLTQIMAPSRSSPYRPLPAGANMRVAMRRTLRAGDLAGTPVEDLGVRPDYEYRMSRRDLLGDNADLMEFAGWVLSRMPLRRLVAQVHPLGGGRLGVRAWTRNVERVDVYLDGRPDHSLDVADGVHDFAIAMPPHGASKMELRGYAGDAVAVCTSVKLG
jgi:hypothetical protein